MNKHSNFNKHSIRKTEIGMIGKRRIKTTRVFALALAAIVFCMASHSTVASAAESTEALVEQYTGMLNQLRAELTAKVPKVDLEKAKTPGSPEAQQLKTFLTSDKLDAKLAKYVVLLDATPKGLAEFAQQGKEQALLIEQLLADDELMKQMLVADGAKGGRYGSAIKIYTDIQKASEKAKDGVLQRLALGTSLEHAVPIKLGRHTPAGGPTVDPVKRYLQFEKAYLGGELDPAFEHLTAWDLRYIVNGDESSEMLVWGREMLRSFRPDQIYTADNNWRYVGVVRSNIPRTSAGGPYDRPELDFYQNILMNYGICGRQAFFGRFMLRCFGIPTAPRGEKGHAALVHWTPKGWVPCLGRGWGAGRGGTDLDLRAVTQGRATGEPYMQVVRARSVGDVLGEKRAWGFKSGVKGIWNGIALRIQQEIIEEAKSVPLKAIGEPSEPTLAMKVMATPVTPADRKVSYGKGGIISIPAAAYSKPAGEKVEVTEMKSFAGGLQIYLPRFGRTGVTILRGGCWRIDSYLCKSGARLPSSSFGRYNNWGLRAAMTHSGGKAPREVTLDLGKGLTMEMVYIKPGKFVMGGEVTKGGKWTCVEVPKHEVTITKGFYMGKYEVTQAQFKAMTGSNPSSASKDPNCPADNIDERGAWTFCKSVALKTGQDVRLPTEAEWEFACRAGSKTLWFFGDDDSKLGDYAWYKKNDGGKSHPVGQKKPNPWGLYDICGNVCERVADSYVPDYYAKSPKEDPTGPKQADKSRLEYTITVPKAGKYALVARVVTANYYNQLFVSANGDKSESRMMMPYTLGKWQDSKPITLALKKGENWLQFLRRDPPQWPMVIKSFTLKPLFTKAE
jgi:formylglycine-generating enzyme required for sulfatase activity